MPLFVDDIEIGIDRFDYSGPIVERTPYRAGLIKVATDEHGVTDRARRCFMAAAEASQRTGAPILTHTEGGHDAMAQIELLDELGVPLDRVVLSHTDKITDPAHHRDLLATGVNLEYDQALRIPSGEGDTTADLVAEAAAAGYIGQIMLGTDGARRSLWTTLGGAPGLAAMGSVFIADLAARGLDTPAIDQVFATNPQRFLTLEEAA